jgi:broad specificity phosphatase PhoE
VSGRVTLLVPAPTAATATAAFSADEPLDARGRAWAGAGRGRVPRADRVRHAPERAARQTCEVLGLTGDVDRSLRGWDVGRWAGRRLVVEPAAAEFEELARRLRHHARPDDFRHPPVRLDGPSRGE